MAKMDVSNKTGYVYTKGSFTYNTPTTTTTTATTSPPKRGNEGWVCPKCGRANAPWVDYCPCFTTTPWPLYQPHGSPTVWPSPYLYYIPESPQPWDAGPIVTC